jgi:hypothetical protein
MITDINYYCLDHSAVDKKFSGDLVYLGSWQLKGEDYTSAFYYVKNPDKSKGHKSFMLLSSINGNFFVRGKEFLEILPLSEYPTLECSFCKDIIYSPHRHTMVTCSCEKVCIDGGNSEYFRIEADKPEDYIYKVKNLLLYSLKEAKISSLL